jgi:hypothetical protein
LPVFGDGKHGCNLVGRRQMQTGAKTNLYRYASDAVELVSLWVERKQTKVIEGFKRFG